MKTIRFLNKNIFYEYLILNTFKGTVVCTFPLRTSSKKELILLNLKNLNVGKNNHLWGLTLIILFAYQFIRNTAHKNL